MTSQKTDDRWEEYTQKEILAAVNEVIVDAHGFDDGFRAGMEHGALEVLEQLTGEGWTRHWVAEELEKGTTSDKPSESKP